MTAHVNPNWKLGDELSDEMVEHMVQCIEANKQHDRYQPEAFGTFSAGDKVIFVVAMLLDLFAGRQITQEILEEQLQADDDAEVASSEEAEKLERGMEAVIRILQKMGRWSDG
jgi:hypothetical protein